MRSGVIGAAGVPATLFDEGRSVIAYINRAKNVVGAASYLSSIHEFH